MNSNSLTVYFEKVKPNLSKKQEQVLEAISNLGKCTQYEVARYLNCFPNQISGRFSELIEKGIIKIDGKKIINSRPHSNYVINIK